MKSIFTLVLLSFYLNAIGQTIEPIFQNENYPENNVYYKDMDNDFNPYVGTWLYTNGNTSLKIIFQKKEMVLTTTGQGSNVITFYKDYLIGEYQYIEDGVEKVNTLSNIAINHSDMLDYNIFSNGLVSKSVFPRCNECFEFERRIYTTFTEPTRKDIIGLVGRLMLRKVTVNGVVKLKAIFFNDGGSLGFKDDGTETDIIDHSIPYDTYILEKTE